MAAPFTVVTFGDEFPVRVEGVKRSKRDAERHARAKLTAMFELSPTLISRSVLVSVERIGVG